MKKKNNTKKPGEKKSLLGFDWNNSRVFDLAMEILILAVIFIMPTIFDRRLGIVFSGTKTTWMRVFGSLILGVWAIKLIITRQHRFIRTPLDWPVLSFLLCTTVATLSSVHVYTSFVGFYGRYEGLTSWYLFGLFFFVVTNYIRSFEQIKRIIVTVVSAATLMAVYSVIQRHAIDPYMWGGVVTWQRVIGTIGQPNFLAAYMLLAFFLILALFLLNKKAASAEIDWDDQLLPIGYFIVGQATFLAMIYRLEAHSFLLWYFGFIVITASALLFTFSYQRLHPRIFNVILGLSLVLIYISILYTQSRGGYLGLFAGLVLFGIVAGRKCIFASWKKIAALGFLIVLISGVTMSQSQFSPFRRFTSEISTKKVVVDEEDSIEEDSIKEERTESKLELKGAAGSRGETWISAFRIIADNPFFGIGPEVLKMVFPRYETELFRFKEAFHVKQDRCHNETFDVSVTKGLVGFLVFVWLLFTVFRVGLVKSKTVGDADKLLLAGSLSAILAFLVQNQFSFGVVAITSLFWITWAMVMVIGDEGRVTKDEGRKFSWLDIPWFAVAMVALVVSFLIYISFFSFRGDVWFKSGKTKMQGGDFKAAAEDFERSLKVFPFEGGAVSHSGIAYLNQSNSSEKMENINKAVAALTYGTRIDPYNADNFYMLSKINLMLAGKGDAKVLSQAKEYAEIALKIDPYYAEVYHTMGLILLRQGQTDKAAKNFEKAFLINPELTAPLQNLEAVYRNQGKLVELEKVFRKVLEKYSNNQHVLDRITRFYLERGELDKALKHSEKMVKFYPKSSEGYILRAMVFVRKGRLNQAFSDLQQVIINDPKNVQAHNELGRVYLIQGNKAKAKEEFEQVISLDAGNVFAKSMLDRLK
ncbi:MAG: tetratricopeptide repeat protein [Candidatus Margulisiibacteriota bacterium]